MRKFNLPPTQYSDMISTNLIITIITIILVIVVLVATIVLAKKKIAPIQFTEKEIPEFSVDLHFDPFPRTVDIENKYDCNADSLRKCDINDPTTLFGCKELTVRCHHFDKDTEYLSNGNKVVIPKNATANEGYALAINVLVDACNPYHGDLALVATNADSTEYMLICNCKNPGYIGNDNILGNCTNVYICNGEIDDINKPLKEINCKCDARQKNIRYEDGLPVCKDMLVLEANESFDDWSNLVPWTSSRLINANVFNKTISGNIKSSLLLDPCRNSLDDMTKEIPNASYDIVNGTCKFVDYGYPVSNGMLNFHPTKDPNSDIKLTSADCGLLTNEWEYVRFTDNVAGVRRITAIKTRNLPFSDTIKGDVIVVPPAGIGLADSSQLFMVPRQSQFVSPRCVGSWPSYNCYIREYYGHNVLGFTVGGSRSCPSEFLWGKDFWNNCEEMVSRYLLTRSQGFAINQQGFTTVNSIRAYGVIWAKSWSNQISGVASFTNEDDYKIHKNVLT